LTGLTAIFPDAPHDRDNCQVCLGLRGGVPGNTNRWLGIAVCDYCSARSVPVVAGQVSASDVAMHRFALSEQLLLLRRTLGDSDIPAEAEHLMRQMGTFLRTLGELPLLPHALPWMKVSDALPGPLDQIFAMHVDGKVRDTLGAILLGEESVPGNDPGATYTHWTLKPSNAGIPSEKANG
jgi:hypothetical protein